MKNPSIVMLAYGRVARQFCDALLAQGYSILQVYNRSKVQLLPNLVDVELVHDTTELAFADVYFIASADGPIEELAKHIPNPDALIVHFSGASSIDVLGKRNRRAVCWPMHSFQDQVDWKKVKVVVEADQTEDFDFLSTLLNQFGAEVHQVNGEQRSQMHLMATLINNFGNHLLHQSEAYAERNNLPFPFFKSLALQTIENAFEKGAKSSQTGPAKRRDIKSLEKHISLIDDEDLLKLYELFSELIMKNNGKDL